MNKNEMTKSNLPIVSAVIITHNRCELLKRAVDSVVKQTYPYIEIIVVDDASDDNTPNYGATLLLEGIKYIRIDKKESNGGNHARNVGFRNSSGKYIAFLDDDDYWVPEKTEKQVNYLEENENVGMVYSGLLFEYDNELLNHPRFPNPNAYGDIVKKQLYIKPFCTTITMMIRRDVLDAICGFDEKVKYWQEYELSLRIIQITKIGYIFQTLSVANRDFKVNRLTYQFEAWNEAVKYIEEKHKALFDLLSEDNKKRRIELYYKEAAYRASLSLGKKKMRQFYWQANSISAKPEYIIRAIFGLSKDKTLLLESLYLRLIAFCKRKQIGETSPNE